MSNINNNVQAEVGYVYDEDSSSDKTLPHDSWLGSFNRLVQKVCVNDRFFWVLLNLLLLAIIFPSLDHAKSGNDILALFFAFFLFSVPYSLRNNDEATKFIYFLSLPFCLVGCALLILPDNLPGLSHPKWVMLPRMVSHMVFFFSLGFYLFRELWLDKAIGFDKIIGGCCLYLIVGMIWAYIYGMVEEFSPGSFAVSNMKFLDSEDGTYNHHVRGSVLLYFSFITLTTVGFGDVTPLAPIARTIVWLEAVFGQFLVTVLLARLVSLYLDYSKDQTKAIKSLEEKVEDIPIPSEKYHPRHHHYQTADEDSNFERNAA